MRIALCFVCLLTVSSPLWAETRSTSVGPLSVTPVVTGLDQPWAMAFLPGARVLVTERGGTLWNVAPNGTKERVSGVPRVAAVGQGGLLDVLVPRDFAQTRHVYLTYAKAQGRGEGTALGRGVLNEDGTRLDGFETLYEIRRGTNGGRHFGSRVVEGLDGFLYMTVGDRGDRNSAQDLSRENGSVLRLTRDGAIPGDNPMRKVQGARPSIWSYGHRNAQGAALDRQGQLWVVEHGARGGDEVNRVERGKNYGWPVISYGTHYSGARIGSGTEQAGMEQPVHYWDPSIAPSGMMFYSGRLIPEWEGDLFVGSLKFGLISRLEGERSKSEVERIDIPETDRVRDIREAPDGSIWFMSVGNGAIYRMAPGGA